MSNSVRISIITVVKNDALHLEETIQSVIRNRAIADIDHIVIDSASTDGTVDIIRKYADHISYWVSEPDNGIYDAMNKGWKSAADGFILFLGAGDKVISLPDMKLFGHHDVVYGIVRMGENKVFKPRADYHLKIYNSLHHQALMIKKSLYPDPPFNCSYQVYADFDFNQRLMKKGVQFVYSPDFKAYAYPGGVSDRDSFGESLRIIFKNFGFLWAAMALSGYYAMALFPLLKRLRPIQDN